MGNFDVQTINEVNLNVYRCTIKVASVHTVASDFLVRGFCKVTFVPTLVSEEAQFVITIINLAHLLLQS